MPDSCEKINILVEPGAHRLETAPGTVLMKALEAAGIEMAYPCAGRRLCGRCRVDFEEGAPPPTDEEKHFLANEDLERGVRLACCTKLSGDARVRLPEAELLKTEHVLNAGVQSEIVVDPEVRCHRVKLPPSTLETPRSDWVRLVSGLPEDVAKRVEPTLDVLRDLPAVVAKAEDSNHVVWATTDSQRVLDVRAGAVSDGRHYGVAVDIGTTTIATALVDLETGHTVATAGCANPQRAFGYDLISRIHAVQTNPENLRQMQERLLNALGRLIEDLCASHGAQACNISSMAMAGNTAMTHIALGVDPTGLGQAPFAGVLRAGLRTEAHNLGLPVHPRAQVYVFPCIGGFVGGDIVAGILVTKLRRQPGVSVLVDIGTNGEVVVAYQGKLYATSSAAGPAFEGGKISGGMMASDGAIDHVDFDGEDFRFSTIGGQPPRGICGSALIELTGRMLETGLVGMNGRIAEPGDGIPKALAARLGKDDDGLPRLLVRPGSNGHAAVYLTQADIREFQLGKGAVQTAILMVLEECGIDVGQIDRLLVAGAFGNHLNVRDSMALGLLPELPDEKVFFIGNSSLEGARCVLLNRYERLRAEEIPEEAKFIELASRPEFQERFAMSMMLGPAMMF